MKPITLLTVSLLATATLTLAEGIPVDHETGKITTAHTVVALTAEQIEETQTLGTLTLTPEQWREVRAKSPQCPKRFNLIFPVTSNDCSCGIEEEYVIAMSRNRVAVLLDGESGMSVESLRYELFKDEVVRLRMNEHGEFHLDGKLVPFQTLLKALATPPEDAKRDDGGKLAVNITNKDGLEITMRRWLNVWLPVGSKPTDAVFESRLRQIAAAADQMGLHHGLFP